MAEFNFEETVQAIVDAIDAERESHWYIGDQLCKAPEDKGLANAIASAVGHKASWVSEHRKTAATFSLDQRAPDMCWSIHVECARTSEPERWLSEAIANQWSTRQLKDALVEAGEKKKRTSEGPAPEIGEAAAFIRRRIEEGDLHTTHYEGCYRDHFRCAVRLVLDSLVPA